MLGNLIYNRRHQYRDSDEGQRQNEKSKSHRVTIICNILFYTFSSSLSRFQTWFGMYLHASGAKEDIIQLLHQYGLSIGNHAIDTALDKLASKQEEKLREIGKSLVTTPYNLIYDNINIHEKVAQQRNMSQNTQFNGVCGFVSKVLGSNPLLSKSDFKPRNLDNIGNDVLLENMGDKVAYNKIVSGSCLKLSAAVTRDIVAI
jgi:hypothetical protein